MGRQNGQNPCMERNLGKSLCRFLYLWWSLTNTGHLFQCTGLAVAFTFLFWLLFNSYGAAVATLPEGEVHLPPRIQTVQLPGLKAAARIIRDTHGIAHIHATNKHDLYFLQGYVHAQDRLFQVEVRRRQASGTLAELLGARALESDVQMRTLGLRRAAERSLEAISPRTRAALEAYAAGVNAFVEANPLPPEYEALELSQFEPWTPLDSLAIAKLIAFGLSFDLDDIGRTEILLAYQQAGAQLGFDGRKLFFEDLFRSAPFDPAATIPDAEREPTDPTVSAKVERVRASAAFELHPRTLELGRQYLDKVKDIPLFRHILDQDRDGGSNEWAVSGKHTTLGFPLLANDQHLSLGTPSTVYPNHLQAPGINVIGSSFAGAPFVITGHNWHISWGATVNPMDVTDIFQEQIVSDPNSPSGLSIVHNGQREPLISIPEVFRQNNLNGVLNDVTVVPPGGSTPPVTLVVPRRNNGPIICLDMASGIALSIQYTGFSPTRELDTFRIWNRAKGLNGFIRGLQFFDFGSQNWAYSDIRGNIAYFTSGELPLREDLQAGFVEGSPPFFIRNGTRGNEWLKVRHWQPGQAIPYEILPFEEMPHLINPPAGYFVNANNDPLGLTLDNDPLNQCRSGRLQVKECQPSDAIYYLNAGYDAGFRASRVTELLQEKLSEGDGKVSFEDMQKMQANTVMRDAQFFVPHILQAFDNARAEGAHPLLAVLANDPSVREAVNRLRGWDFSTPTGIKEGYDAGDMIVDGKLSDPSHAEIQASVVATLYNVWRSQFIRNTIDVVLTPFGLPTPGSGHTLIALRHLLDHFETNHGEGTSGLSFFPRPTDASPADRRDIAILQSLSDALARLASGEFEAAFGRSSNQEDYHWGKLHRIVFEHQLDGPFSIPPAAGAFPSPLAGLPGVPTDGGFEVVDASGFSARAASVDKFMFGSGPVIRFVSEATRKQIRGVSSLPGGTSGVPSSPHYFDLLPAWLTNEVFPLLLQSGDVQRNAESITVFVPARAE